jgi:hypothetical protein
MKHLVDVDHNGMAVHLTKSDSEEFLTSSLYPMQWMGLMIICCGMTVKTMGM